MTRRARTHDAVEHERREIGGLFDRMEQPEARDWFHAERLRPAIRLDDPDWLLLPKTPLEHRFADFHRKNPKVYDALESAALARLEAGETRIGIGKLAEDLRESQARAEGERYAVNNSYRSLYARLLIHRHPKLAGAIELRERKERGAA